MDQKKISFNDMKQSPMNKYRATLINKLTWQDLDEFRFYIRNKYDPEQGWNHEFRMKFGLKLREYFHEEIIQREISSIEAVLKWLKPEDLARSNNG